MLFGNQEAYKTHKDTLHTHRTMHTFGFQEYASACQFHILFILFFFILLELFTVVTKFVQNLYSQLYAVILFPEPSHWHKQLPFCAVYTSCLCCQRQGQRKQFSIGRANNDNHTTTHIIIIKHQNIQIFFCWLWSRNLSILSRYS